MKNEIYEIPYRADLCYKKNKGIILPEHVPYIGMGASYLATKVFRFLGINLFPEVAAEYYNYLVKYKDPKNGVLISQSGQSTETLWCADHFDSFIGITNEEQSPLGNHKACYKTIHLYSGKEDFLPSKTYINTLITLYLGFGFDPLKAIHVLKDKLSFFETQGTELGQIIYQNIRRRKCKSLYILGSGPNIATANLAALILSGITKFPILSMSVSQYDHGHKETAKDSLIIAINHEGPETKRTRKLLVTLSKAGAQTLELRRSMTDSLFSPITYPMPFYFAANYLSKKLKVAHPFMVGDKITRISDY